MKSAKVLSSPLVLKMGAVLAGGAAVYLFVIRPIQKRKREDEKEVEKALNDLPVYNPTLSDREAEKLANELFLEMQGFTIYPNSELWKRAMDITPTKDDVRLVTRKFGIRQGETLQQWMRNEISLGTKLFGVRAKKHFSL